MLLELIYVQGEYVGTRFEVVAKPDGTKVLRRQLPIDIKYIGSQIRRGWGALGHLGLLPLSPRIWSSYRG